MKYYSAISNIKGFEADIIFHIDSNEYQNTFGENNGYKGDPTLHMD